MTTTTTTNRRTQETCTVCDLPIAPREASHYYRLPMHQGCEGQVSQAYSQGPSHNTLMLDLPDRMQRFIRKHHRRNRAIRQARRELGRPESIFPQD